MKTTENITDLKAIGVYLIKNIINNKVYVGSTTRPFIVRFQEHQRTLKNNYHANRYLQRSYDKYGTDNFNFSILQKCTLEEIIPVEQYWTDYYESNNSEKGFNLLKEVEGFSLGHSPWNKGRKYDSTDHLKVSKTFVSEKLKNESYKLRGLRIRENLPEIYMYKSSEEYIGRWDSAKDLEEYSLENNFEVNSRFKKERMGKPLGFLAAVNINKCASGKIALYKGFKFSTTPLYEVTYESVLDNNGEG